MTDLSDQAHQAQSDAEKADDDAAKNPSADSYREAAAKWGKAADLYKKMAEKKEGDWCTAAEAYLRYAEAAAAQAAFETDPAAAIKSLRNAADNFETASDLFLKCGDADSDALNYSDGIGAYAKSAFAAGRRARSETLVEDRFKAKHAEHPHDMVIFYNIEQAEARRKKAEKQREKAKEKQKQASDKFIEISSGRRD